MKRVFGKAEHNPWRGTWGDCLQACVASLLDMPLEAVPHFMGDGCSGEEGFARVRNFLRPRGMSVVVFQMPSGEKLEVGACHIMGGLNGAGDSHVVVAHDMVPIHNPDLGANDFMDPDKWIRPYENGTYEIWMLVHTSRPEHFAKQLQQKEAA